MNTGTNSASKHIQSLEYVRMKLYAFTEYNGNGARVLQKIIIIQIIANRKIHLHQQQQRRR